MHSLRERVGYGRFKHGHMENQMDRVHKLWEVEGKQWCTRLGNDFVGSEIFFREFL